MPDQGRPRRPRADARQLPPPRGAVRRHAARRRPDRDRRPAGRAHQRAARAQRGRQVHARQRARPRRLPVGRRGERRHRTRAAHLGHRADAGPPGRRLDRGHPRDPLLRPGPRRPRPADRGVPGPARADPGLSARLHARRERTRVRAERGHRPAGGAGAARSGGCSPAARPASRTEALLLLPDRPGAGVTGEEHQHEHGHGGERDEHHQRLLQRRHLGDAVLARRRCG